MANRAAFVALALVLVGCTSGGTFGWLEQYGTDFESAFDYGAGGRDFSTVVVGNPFGGDAAAFGRSVASTLTARNTFQPINFTTDPGPSARLQYRLVLLFNSERRVVSHALCADSAALSVAPSTSDKVTIHAAFCNGPLAMRAIVGSIRGVTGPDDRRFDQFLGEMAHLLFCTNERAEAVQQDSGPDNACG